MTNYWNDQSHMSPADRQYSTNNDKQSFTLFVEDLQSSVDISDAASITSSMSRPSTLRASSSESGMSFASQTTLGSNPKRSRRESYDYEGDQDTHHNTLRPQKRTKRVTPIETESTLLFACPYAKYDPSRYSASNLQELNYRSCSKCYLTDIARVKQHLYRVHERSKFHCSRCFEIFETQNILLDHVFSNSCALQECSSFDEKMTAEQSAIIRKKTRGADPEFTWYEIYRTLFPGAPLPLAPYATFANQGSDSLDAFIQFVQEHLPRRLSEQFIDSPMVNGIHTKPVASSIETCLATIMQEIRLDFSQSSQRNGSPLSLKASPATREPSPIRLPSEVKTEYAGEDLYREITCAGTTIEQRGNENEQIFGSDAMINDVAMELYGLPTAIYNPQVASTVASNMSDYFAGFHQAVTMPY